MRRSRAPVPFALLLVVIAACTVGSNGEGTTIDLDDEAVLDQLGIPTPEGVIWRRTIGEVEVLGTTRRALPSELEIIGAGLAELPPAFSQAVELRNLVRAENLGTVDLHPATLAFARGPDIYLLDRTFSPELGGSTRMGMARILAHEMTHAAQFRQLDPDYVRALLDSTLIEIDAGAASTLVADFADSIGWRNLSDDPLVPRWQLSQSAGTTVYGLTSPDEDMAESVAMVVTGRANHISPDRARWVERWLGADAAELAAGKPWSPSGAEEITSVTPIYDSEGVARLRPTHAEPLYYALSASAPGIEELRNEVERQLRRRGLAGSLDRTEDERLPRYAGTFSRSDGVVFWVELWDFRQATGFRSPPDGPILTYVVLW